MAFQHSRRDILKLMGVGGVVFASGLAGATGLDKRGGRDKAGRNFFFLQLSDTHWGFQGGYHLEGSRRDHQQRGFATGLCGVHGRSHPDH